MNKKDLITFIKEQEKEFGEHTTAKEKWLILDRLIQRLEIAPKPLIVDAGGTEVTAQIIKHWFPDSTLSVINTTSKIPNNESLRHIKADLEVDFINKFFDKRVNIIFFMDVLEHLYDPDKAIRSLLDILDEKGYLIISTPNLADLYNRVFLLLGYSLHNYNVSQWYKTGNPLIKDLSGKRHGNHKSVFTVKQLVELLEEVYGLKTLIIKGYSYYEPDWLSYYGEDSTSEICRASRLLGHNQFRRFINKISPPTLSEGFLIIAQNR